MGILHILCPQRLRNTRMDEIAISCLPGYQNKVFISISGSLRKTGDMLLRLMK
jgi:hypothetical protein